MSIHGFLHRGEYSCRARAINSLPEPLSPVTSTAAFPLAILCTKHITFCSASLEITAGIPRNEQTFGFSIEVSVFLWPANIGFIRQINVGFGPLTSSNY